MEEVAEEPAPLGETLAEAGVEVVDGAGEVVPLVEELAIVDPWFKVGTTTYEFTTLDCDPDPLTPAAPCANPLQAAVDYISNNGKIPSDGFIHVDAGTINNQKVVVDGTLSYLNSLKGISGHVNPDTFTPDAILGFTDGSSGSYFRIQNRSTAFTLSGLDISGNSSGAPGYGVVDFADNVGSILLQDLVVNDAWNAAEGIRIRNHSGLVTLKNVDSSSNAGGGAYINNSDGTAGVVITNSSFSDNLGSPAAYPATGLHIITNGSVTITGINASRNAGTYANLWIEGASSVNIKSSEFIGNTASRGIDIQGVKGTVTLTNVYADSNFLTGIYVRTKGTINFNGVDASKNLGGGSSLGADLDNCLWDAGLSACVGTGSVTVSNSSFQDNYRTGLSVHTHGNITLTNVSSSYNDSVGGSYGAALNNYYGTGYIKVTNLPSTDTNMQPGFNYNHDRGLDIHTGGYVTLTNVNMIGNDEEGIYVWQDYNKGVTMKNCRVDGNNSVGILINSLGPIIIDGGHANNNIGWGVRVHNEAAPDSAPKPITISNFTANNNDEYGFYIESKGAIKLTNVTAESTDLAVTSTAIYLDNSYGISPGVTLSKVTAYNNDYDGIMIITKGSVALTSVTADWNDHYGLYIAQSGATPTSYPTTKITTGSISNNNNYGLIIYGRGAITLKDVKADHNAGNGAYIENVSGNVSLLASSKGGNSFTNNHGTHDGIDINTSGSVVLNKVTANGNTGATGVYIYPTAMNVTATGGEFSGQNYGLYAPARGTIKVDNIIAASNVATGIFLNNLADTTGAKNITIYRTKVSGNGIGLTADTYGTILVNKIEALNNTGVGVDLDNTYGAFTTPKNISVLGSYGTSNISMNTGTGLLINTKGIVVISKMTANENVARAIDINNYQGGLGKGTISISYVTANNNGQRAIAIVTNNAVTFNAVTILFNGFSAAYYGIGIDNTYGHNVKVTNSLISGNAGSGILATIGTGVFTISNSFYFGNSVVSGGANIQIYH